MGSQYGASSAPMTGTGDDHDGDKSCVDTSMVIRGELQMYRSTGRNRDNK